MADDPLVRNQRDSSLLLTAGFLAAFVPLALVALILGLSFLGLVLAVVLAGAATAGCWWTAQGVALRRTRAQPASLAAQPRLHNLVDGLCAANGVAKPDLYVVDDPAPNAFTVGRSADHAALVVTAGLVEAMSRVELEAVLAHELSHIKNDDILVDTLAVTMPVTARLVHRALARTREPGADLAAVEMTRYPPALASALTKLREGTTYVSASPRSTAHLWIAAPRSGTDSPGAADGSEGRFDDHRPLDERIATLQEL